MGFRERTELHLNIKCELKELNLLMLNRMNQFSHASLCLQLLVH